MADICDISENKDFKGGKDLPELELANNTNFASTSVLVVLEDFNDDVEMRVGSVDMINANEILSQDRSQNVYKVHKNDSENEIQMLVRRPKRQPRKSNEKLRRRSMISRMSESLP